MKFSDFLIQWVHELSEKLVSAHLDPFFEEYETPLLKLSAILYAFDSNPDYKTAFTQWVVSQRGKDAEAINFDGSIRMVGLKTASHFLIACMLSDRMNVKSLQRDKKTGLFLVPLDRTLPYAHKALKSFKDGTRYHEIAFQLGFFFDYISFYNELN